MHSAYLTNCARVGPNWPVKLTPVALDWDVVVLRFGRLATPLCAGTPPQAVTSKPAATATARTPRGWVVAFGTCRVSHSCGILRRARRGGVTRLGRNPPATGHLRAPPAWGARARD